MAKIELIEFIRPRINARIARADIEKALRIEGYSDEDIAEAFAVIVGSPEVALETPERTSGMLSRIRRFF